MHLMDSTSERFHHGFLAEQGLQHIGPGLHFLRGCHSRLRLWIHCHYRGRRGRRGVAVLGRRSWGRVEAWRKAIVNEESGRKVDWGFDDGVYVGVMGVTMDEGRLGVWSRWVGNYLYRYAEGCCLYPRTGMLGYAGV